MGMKSALVKPSDTTFKIPFYPQTCPKSRATAELMVKTKLWFHVGPISGLLHISHSAWDFVFSSHRCTHTLTVQMPATICMLHLPHLLPNQHKPSPSHFSHNKLSFSSFLTKLQGNTRTKVPPSCLGFSASCHFITLKSVSALNWNVLSTGEVFMHLHLLCSFKSLQRT